MKRSITVLKAALLSWRRWREPRRKDAGRKQTEGVAEGSEQRFRSLVQNAFDVILIMGADQTVRYVSPAVESVLGYKPEEVIGKNNLAPVHPDDLARVRRAVDAALSNPGTPSYMELRIRHADGSWRHLESACTSLLGEPSVEGIVFNSRDVTERKRDEKALKESEARYRMLVEQTPTITYIDALDQEEFKHEISYVSPQVEELLGYSQEEWASISDLWQKLLHPDDRERVFAEEARTEETGAPFSAEYRIIARDGRTVHIRDDAVLVRDDSGQPRFWQGVMCDITDRKEAEARLREAEEKYRMVVERVPAVIYIQEAANSNAVTYVSPQMEAMLGYELEQWTSDPECWVRTLHPADRKRVLTETRRANETGEPFKVEYRRYTQDGRVVWISDEATLVRDERGGPWYWLGVQVDVTERKRVEEALDDSELRLRTVITNLPVMLFALDYAGVFKLSEGKGLDALGLKPGEAVGRAVSEIHGDKPEILEDVDRALAGEELRAVRRIGSRSFEIWYSPLRTHTDEVLGVIGVAVDVTDRERAVEALRQSEERFRKLSEAAFEGIVIHDGGRVLEANEACAAMHGYELSEILGRSILELVAPEYRDLVRRNILSGYEETYESVDVRKDGTRIDVEVRGRALSYQGRTVSVAAVRDVTERKRAEGALREAEERYRTLVEQIPAVAYMERPDNTSVYTSPRIETMLGYTINEWSATELWAEKLYPDDREWVLAADDRSKETGEPFAEEYRLLAKDGRVVWVRDEAMLLRDKAGEPLYWHGILTDVTERKRAEEAVRESEARFRAIFENAALGISIADLDRRLMRTNSAYQNMLGYSEEELVGKPITELSHPDDVPAGMELNRKLLAGKLDRYQREKRYIRKDGEVVWVRPTISVVRDAEGEPQFLVGMVEDITERKHAEEKLRQQAELLDLSHEPILVWDFDGGIVYWNRGCEELYGFPREAAVGRANHQLLQTEYPVPLEQFEFALEREGQWIGELTQTTRDGRRVTVESRHMLVRVADGRRLVLETNRDITERKRAEEALRESEERYRRLVELSPESIIVHSEGRLVYANPTMAKLFGVASPEELIGRPVLDLVHPDYRDIITSRIQRTLETDEPAPLLEEKFVRLDGSVIDLEVAGMPISYLGKPAVQAVLRDVTERKRAEEALRESEERHRRQARELDLLHQVRTALAQELELPTVFHTVVETIVRTYGYTQVSAYLLQGETLVLQHQVGYERVLDRIPIDRGIMGRVVRNRRPVLLENVRSDPAFLGADEGITSELCVPLFDEGEVAGTLNVESTRGVGLTEDDLRLMTALAEHVNVAISRARLYTRLRESEERFRSLIQNASDVITLLEADGTIRYQSPSIERVLGYRPEELVGENAFDYVHPEDLERVLGAFAEGLEDPGSRPSEEYRFRHKDGTWCYLESIGSNLLGDPKVGKFVVNSRDITERKQVEEVQARLARQAELRADVSAALTESGALPSPLQRCAEAIVADLGAAFARVWTIDEEESVLELQASAGIYTHTDGLHGRIPLGEFKVGLIAREGRPHLTNDVLGDPRISDKEWAKREGISAFAGYPLLVEDRLVGVMALFAREPLTEDTIEALALVADMIAQGIERKRAEEALRRSEKSLAEAQRIAHVGNWEYEVQEDRARWSDEMYRIFGFSTGEFIPTYRTFLGLVHPDDKELIRRAVREALYGGGRSSIEYRIVRLNGEVRYVHSEYEVLGDEVGRPKRLIGTVHDNTERKKTEEALRESEERYRLVARATNEVIWDNDLTTNAQIWDGATEAMFGYSPEEMGSTAEWWEEHIHPDDRERVLANTEAALRNGGETWTDEYRFRRADGAYVTVVDRAYLVRDAEGRPVRMLGSIMDVTERKQAEERLREAEARYRTLVEQIPAVVYIQDIDERDNGIAYISPQIEDIMGYSPQEYLEDPEFWIRATHSEDRERVLAEDARAYRTGEPFLVEFRKITRDGRVIWVRDEAVVVTDAEGHHLYWQGILTDITERKKTEEALRRGENRLATAQKIAHVGSWEYVMNEGRLYWSDELYRIFGLTPGQVEPTYRAFMARVHPDDRDALRKALVEAIRDRSQLAAECRIVKPDGEVRAAQCQYDIEYDETGKPAKIAGTVQDITERKRAEEEMKEANRRLAELAVLKADFTAMVAHELDTPLAVIRGYADMMATGELGPTEQSQALDKIQSETDLLEALVSDVRTAAAVEREAFIINPQPITAGALLEDAAAFVETLPGDHPLVVEDDTDGQELWADPYRIGQVLRNLLSNAAKYSPEGAPVKLRAISGEKTQRVRIEVEDRGTGIHPDDTARIFEKFGRGRDRSGRKVAGVGLGLYLSRRLLQAHGSELTLDSTPGGSSVFGFELEVIR